MSKQQLVGVDIGSSSVKIVELKAKKKGFIVKGAVEVALTPDVIVEGAIMDYGEVAGAVSNAYKKGKFSSKNAAAGLKGSAVIAKRLTVPITDKNQLRDTFLWEAEQYIQMDVEEVSIDYEVVNTDKDRGETDLVLAVARKELIVDFKSVLEAAKLRPIVIDLEVFSMINAFSALNESEDSPVLLVNIGHTTTLIVIVKNGNYEFSREIQRGGKSLCEFVSQSLSISAAEAETMIKDSVNNSDQEFLKAVDSFNVQLSMEIKNSVEMFDVTSQVKPSECYLFGGCAVLPGLKEKIAEAVETQTFIFDPFSGMEIASQVDKQTVYENSRSFAVAVGLALRGAVEK